MSKEEKHAIEYIKFKTIAGLETLQLEKDVKALEIVLNYIDKLQKENKEAYHKGFIDGIISSKYIIGNKKEEYEDMLKTLNNKRDTDRIKAINERIIGYKELMEMIK